MSMECAACAQDLDHCHGSLVVHLDGVEECTEPDCVDLDQVRHTLVVDCREVQGGCRCTITVETALLRAS